MLDKITIIKKGSKGDASVFIVDEDENTVVLNGFVIDITDGANPVNIIKYNGSPIISGNVISGIKDLILNHYDHNMKNTLYHCIYRKDEVERMLADYYKKKKQQLKAARRKPIVY